MDMVRSEVRKLAAEDYSTVQHLAHASQQARERNYQDFLIVDVDAHHYESESYKDVFEYIESPVIRRQAVNRRNAAAALPCSAARSATRTSAGALRATNCAGTTFAATTSSAPPITVT